MRASILITVITVLFFGDAFGQQTKLETTIQNGHNQSLSAFDITRDGRFLASGANDRQIILWNLEKGKILRSFNFHTAAIRSLRFNDDGTLLLSAARDGELFVYHVQSGQIYRNWKVGNDAVWEAEWSDDSKYIIASDTRDKVFIYDVEKNQKIGTYHKEYSAHITSNLVSPNGNLILSKVDYKTVALIDFIKKDTIHLLETEKAKLMSFSPNGKYVAISSAKLQTDVFDASTGKLKYQLINNEEKCDGCGNWHVFAGDDQLITTSNKTDICVWSLTSGRVVKRFDSELKRPTDVLVNGEDLIINYGDFIASYNIGKGKLITKLERDNLDYLSFAENQKFIATSGSYNEVEVWEVNNLKRTKYVLRGFKNRPRADGMRWDYNSYWDKAILQDIERKRKAVLSPNNELIALTHIDSTILILDTETGRIIHRLGGHTQTVIDVDFSNDGKYLISGGADRRVNLYNIENGSLIKTFKGHGEAVFDVEFGQTNDYFISAGWDATLFIWETEGEEYRYVDFGNNSPYTIGFTNNDLYILTGDLGGGLKMIEFDTGKPAVELIGHGNIVSATAIHPISKSLITGGWDGSAKVWDLNSGLIKAKLNGIGGGVFSVDFHPIKTIAAVGGGDKSIRIWDFAQNKVIAVLEGHNTAITHVQFTETGDGLLSTSIDGVIKLWNLEENEEIFTRIQISSEEWLVSTVSGHFDGSANALKNINYVSGMEVLPVNSFFKQYYTPKLLERMKRGEEFDDQGQNFENNMEKAPAVELALSGQRGVKTGDTLKDWTSESISLELLINSNGVGIDDIHLYNNGKLVFHEALEENVVFRGDSKSDRVIKVELSEGINRIQAIVENGQNIGSVPTEIVVIKSGDIKPPKLFVLAVGINEYANPNYHLNYAVNDASSFVEVLSNNNKGLFEEVIVLELFNEKAQKTEVKKAFQNLSTQASVNDVFVFYYAGHGVVGEGVEGEEFYMVMQNLTNLYGGKEELMGKGLSATELMNFSLNIAAQKQLFVIDACHSGEALNAVAQRGAQREKILAQLARSSGTYFLTAAQSSEYANESGSLNHGLFTYAMLEVLAGKNANDEEVSVGELKSYVEKRVPELSEEYHGTAQYPTGYAFGQDFPIILLPN